MIESSVDTHNEKITTCILRPLSLPLLAHKILFGMRGDDVLDILGEVRCGIYG